MEFISLFHIQKMSSNQFLMLLVFSISLASFLLLILKQSTTVLRARKSKISKNLPPGPKKLPIIGNLHQLGSLPHRSLHNLSRTHGPVMFLQLGSIPTLIISSADMAREVFKNHDLSFSGRPQLYAATKVSYGCSDVTFAPYGESWREARKIVTVEMLSFKRVQSFQAAREEEVGSFLDSLLKSFPRPINLSEMLYLLVNNFVCRVAFGKKYNDHNRQVDGGVSMFHKLLHETQELLGGFCLADFFPSMVWLNKFNGVDTRLEKNFRELDSFYDEVIDEHLSRGRPEHEQEDLVDVLLRVQKDPSQAIALTDDQVKGVITDIFLAGTDTSAITLEWAMSELIRNPSAMKRAQDEVRGAVKGSGEVKESDVEGLMYLKAVVKETLRLHPAAPLLVPRETTESCSIVGDSYTIPAKTRVFINAISIATDPKYWEDPDKFWPERFLNSSVDYKGQNFEYLPFGVGRRGCPGVNFAVQLMELVLASLLHGFEWELPHGMRIEDLDMEETFGLTMHKKVPLWVVAKPVTM